MAVLVRILFLVVSILGARGQTGLTQPQQLTDTAIYQVSCDQAAGAFIIDVYNGFLTPEQFALSGVCTGIAAPLSPDVPQFGIDPRSNATHRLYGPASSSKTSLSIYGAQCTIALTLIGSATNGQSTGIIQRIPAVCGPFQAGQCDCDNFFSLSCYVNNCDPLESTLMWIFICIGWGAVVGISYLLYYGREQHELLSKHHKYNSGTSRKRGTELQKKIDDYVDKVRDGKMTKADLENQQRAINKELRDPQYFEMQRLEYMTAAGTKYNELEGEEEPMLNGTSTSIEMDTFTSGRRDHEHQNGHVDVYARPSVRNQRRFGV